MQIRRVRHQAGNKPTVLMHTVTLTLDDLVFANRNQAYGAYALRQTYRNTLTRALVIAATSVAVLIWLPSLWAVINPSPVQVSMTEVDLTNLSLETPPQPVVLPPKTELSPVAPSVRNVIPEVVADAPEEAMPIATVDELKTAPSGQTTQVGEGEEIILVPEATIAPSRTETAVEVAPKPDPSNVYLIVEQQPAYPGGPDALRNYLQRNLHYPTPALRSGTAGRVIVSLIINTDGSVTSVAVLKGIGFGCDEEAMRVVNGMPRWKPGKQSGQAVRVKFNLPIVFALE